MPAGARKSVEGHAGKLDGVQAYSGLAEQLVRRVEQLIQRSWSQVSELVLCIGGKGVRRLDFR